jgi:hypothetical protein
MAPESDWIRMWLDVYGSSFPIGSLEGRILACGASWSGWVGHPWGEKRLRFPREEGARGRNPLSSSSLRTLAFSSLSQPTPRWLRPPLAPVDSACSNRSGGPVCWDNAATQSCWSTLKTELCSRHSWPTKARETTHRRPLDRGALQPPPTPLSADHDDPSRVSGGVGCQPRGRIGRRGSMPDEQLP